MILLNHAQEIRDDPVYYLRPSLVVTTDHKTASQQIYRHYSWHCLDENLECVTGLYYGFTCVCVSLYIWITMHKFMYMQRCKYK